ncbi:ABC transporter substrate-binding protein [Devosia nitrariae]|uniref:ABC transporter substrate-binding protein n=1 Tax=Devosia nitrariae TaxID=2071872 RepID=A0ABQ5W7F6_9HYPH|nr:ABC transporter substrate-binding protein [Devosia nitrariae]GLQ55818.1 ABC transporter substrate-binding protein [Devosia nitrariae]
MNKTKAIAATLGAFAFMTAMPVQAQDDRPVLTIGVQTLPQGFDPSMNISNTGQRVTASIYDKLIARAYWEGENGDGANLVPSIATEWRQVSETEWEVDIRTDVVFHDGTPMTVEDVAFSFGSDLMWGPERIYKAGTTYYGTFADVSVIDDDTVKFTTTAPDPIFPARFTSPLGMVVPKAYFLENGMEAFNLAPVGTGPYKLAEYKPGEIIRLVSHDEYWGGLPPAQEIIFREIPEEAGRITGLLNGELDMIVSITPDQQAVIDNSGVATVKAAVIDNSRVVALNTFEPPMDDRYLRQALVWAIDREAIVEALWGGQNRIPHDFNFVSHGQDFLADRPNEHYDPERARELLAQSDYNGEDLIFRIQAGYYANYEQVAQVLQQQWRDVGINVTLEIRDNFAEVTAPGKHMFAHSNGVQIPDITHPIVNIYGPEGIRTRPDAAGYSWDPTPEFLDLIVQLETTVDHAERIAVFEQVLDILDEERPQIELFQAMEYYGIRNGIDWKPYSFWPMDFRSYNLSID